MGSHAQISVTSRLVRQSCAQESLPEMGWLNPLPPWRGPVRHLFLAILVSLILGALSDSGHELLGAGGCRGEGWNTGSWPVTAGKQTRESCSALCQVQDGCTSFSLGKSEDCFLFGHEKILPVKALGGECYRIVKTAGGKSVEENETEKPKPEPSKPKSPPAPKAEEKPKATPTPKPAAKPAPPPQKPVPKAEEKPAEKKIEKVQPKATPKKVEKPAEPESIDGKYVVEVGEGGCRGKNWNQPPFPIDQGRLSKTNCAKVCLKNDCSAFHMLHPEDDGTAECFLYGHTDVIPVTRIGGTCYSMSDKAPTVSGAIDEDDPDEEQEVKGPVHMAVLGKGRCRGPRWTYKKWPVVKGLLSARQCAEACARKKGCTSFDLSDLQADKTFDCALYGHKKVAPAHGVPGNCYILSEKEGVVPGGLSTVVEAEEDDQEEENVVSGDVEFHQLGKGRCRGPGWTFKKWPVIRGHLAPKDCAVACAKKKGCTAFDVAPMLDGVEECAIYGHKKVTPASGVSGDCYVLGKSDDVAQAEEEPEEEEVDDGVTHKFKHLGHGMCRGAKWTDKKWPVLRGMRTLQECANSCGRKKGCTAFDISKKDEEHFDCMLYGHKHPVPAPGVPGECYSLVGAMYIEETHEIEETPTRRPSILDEDDEDFTNIQNVELLGKGACRGKGWQDGQWPLAKGRQTLGDCADSCKKATGCVAFDLSNKDGDKYDCLLLGHPGVLPASALAAKCYVIKGAKPVKATLMDNSKSAKKADDSYPSGGDGYSKIGSGLR